MNAGWTTPGARWTGPGAGLFAMALAAFLASCGDTPRTPGAAEAMVTLTDANFEQEVSRSTVPVLVDFWASWCGPCQTLAPTIDEIAVKYKGRVKVCKYEITRNNRKHSDALRIDGIPHVILFKNGEPLANFLGIQPQEKFEQVLNKTLAESPVATDNR